MEKEISITIPIPEGFEIDKERSTHTNIVCKPKKIILPKTWEEYKELTGGKLSYYENSAGFMRPSSFSGSYYEFKDKDTVAEYVALGKLIQLRDYYNDGWKPNWESSSEKKYIIYTSENEIFRSWATSTNRVLAFKTEELRDQFYYNFKDLLETAKSLI